MDIFCIKLSWPASFAVQNIDLFGKFFHILWTDSTFQRSPHCNKINTTCFTNGLLFGLPKAQIAKLQHVQNAASRLIFGFGKFSDITPALYELHWLPLSLRIDYKILLLIFKWTHGLAPTYLCDLISIKSNSPYNLRSTDKLLLTTPIGSCLRHWEQDYIFSSSSETMEWPTYEALSSNITWQF